MPLTSEQQQKLAELGRAWNAAKTQQERDAIHAQANAIRDAAGLRAGVDYDATTGASLRSSQQSSQPDYASMINQIYDQQRQAQLAALRAAREKAIGDLNLQKQQVAPMYQQKRDQADVGYNQNVQRLREIMAQNGLLQGGDSVSALTQLQAARQNALNDLNMQEQQTINDINKRISDLQNSQDEQSLIAALEAERAKALYQGYRDSVADQQWNKQFGLQEGQLTGRYLPTDARSLIEEALANKAAYGSASPDVQRQLAARNQDIYRQLDAIGIDSSLINGNVTLDQARRNVLGLGIPTLQRQQMDQQRDQWQKQFEESIRQFNAKLEQEAKQFAEEMGYKYAALNQQERLALAGMAARASGGGGSSSGGGISFTGDKTLDRSLMKDLLSDANKMYQALSSGQLTYDQAAQAIRGARLTYGDAYADGLQKVLDGWWSDRAAQAAKTTTSDANERAKRSSSSSYGSFDSSALSNYFDTLKMFNGY